MVAVVFVVGLTGALHLDGLADTDEQILDWVARDAETVKPLTGYMAQRFSLYSELTVMENLLFFAELYDVPIFANIAASESRHMGAVGRLVLKYGLTDPVVDDTVGIFVNSFLLEKYYELVAKGQLSELDALMVGAFIEELDIIDLQESIEKTDEADIEELYFNLMRGSRNHLRAFVELIEEATGENYEAQLLDQDEVDAITDSPFETGLD